MTCKVNPKLSYTYLCIVNIRPSEPVENFYNLFEPKLMAMTGSKISDTPENDGFVISFVWVKECKEDSRKMRESKMGVGLDGS